MQNQEYIVQIIKNRIKMKDVLSAYGFGEPNRHGRMPCPLHGGKDDNFSVKDDFAHCFVCGESVDVISFVEKMDGIGFVEAVEKLDKMFGLGLNIGKKPTLRESREAARKCVEIKRERIERERKKKELEEMAELTQRTYESIYDMYMENKPKKGEKSANMLFRIALGQLEYTRYRADEAADALWNYEHQR